MQTVKVRMRGLSPLLMHAYPMEPIEAIEKKSPKEQAELATYRDPETKELYVPGVAIQRALIGAAAYSKGKGRGSLVRAAAATFMVSPERISLKTKTYAVDARPVVMPATKGRVVRYRPRLDQWEILFELVYDETLMSSQQVRRIVDDMGSRVGLLDFRPERKGPFGRCVVVEWK